MTANDKKKLVNEKRAMRFSFGGAAVILAAELLSWFFTRSNTILMDCIFDSMDLILVGPFLILIPLLYKPVSERHPYGYSQFEALFIVLKYSALVAVCLSQLRSNILLIRQGGHLVVVSDVVSFELATLAVCLTIFLILHHYSRKYRSEIIRTELYAWRFDVLSSAGIAAAFLLEIPLSRTKFAWLCPYMDPAIAIVMTCVLLVEPIQEIYRNLRELLLFSAPEEDVAKVRAAAEEELGKFGGRVSFLETVRTGRKTWIEIYVDSSSDVVSLRDLADATAAIEERLKGVFDQYYVEIIPDVMRERRAQAAYKAATACKASSARNDHRNSAGRQSRIAHNGSTERETSPMRLKGAIE